MDKLRVETAIYRVSLTVKMNLIDHYITLRKERRIEEAPIPYKPIQSVIDVQVKAEMVDVVARLCPVLTFKA
ncbi:RtcB family protein [Nostoc sp. CHAB 5834]|nr:RtcB family protein [Nostoc sp. CHAB 5834]